MTSQALRSKTVKNITGHSAFALILAVCVFFPTWLSAETRWLGPDDQLLPFTNNQEIVDFLLHADITSRKVIEGSANKPERLVLERDGVRARAIFRTVKKRGFGQGGANHRMMLRDDYIFEVAAYELATLLNLDHVPPATVREIDGQEGSIQLWVEAATPESDRLEAGTAHLQPALFNLQMHRLMVFDALILNYDRNNGNMLVGDDGKLWFVDHTRTFMRMPSLGDAERLVHCDRHLFKALQELDPKVLKASLSPYLEKAQLNALLKRRTLLLKRFDNMIAEHGEDAVLFELEPHLAALHRSKASDGLS